MARDKFEIFRELTAAQISRAFGDIASLVADLESERELTAALRQEIEMLKAQPPKVATLAMVPPMSTSVSAVPKTRKRRLAVTDIQKVG